MSCWSLAFGRAQLQISFDNPRTFNIILLISKKSLIQHFNQFFKLCGLRTIILLGNSRYFFLMRNSFKLHFTIGFLPPPPHVQSRASVDSCLGKKMRYLTLKRTVHEALPYVSANQRGTCPVHTFHLNDIVATISFTNFNKNVITIHCPLKKISLQ